MDKSKLSLLLIGIGIFIILVSGISEKLSFEALGNSLTGIIFIIIGLITYTKNKKTRDNK